MLVVTLKRPHRQKLIPFISDNMEIAMLKLCEIAGVSHMALVCSLIFYFFFLCVCALVENKQINVSFPLFTFS